MENYQVFQVFKALASRMKETVGVYAYDVYMETQKDSLEGDQARHNCLNPAKYVIGEPFSKNDFTKVSIQFNCEVSELFFLFWRNESTEWTKVRIYYFNVWR